MTAAELIDVLLAAVAVGSIMGVFYALINK
jgi:hypothetical protein